MAIYASFSGSVALHQAGVQAAYICSLGVILWRMKDALQAHLAGVMSSKSTAQHVLQLPTVHWYAPPTLFPVLTGSLAAEARNLRDGREEQNKKLRALVASLKQQLENDKEQMHTYMQQAKEMRKQWSTAGEAGENLQQQVRVLHVSCVHNNSSRSVSEFTWSLKHFVVEF